MRRAINCEYCAPKSRTTMAWLSLDWVSTDECLKSASQCKGRRATRANGPLSVDPCEVLTPQGLGRFLYWSLVDLKRARIDRLVVHDVSGPHFPLHHLGEAVAQLSRVTNSIVTRECQPILGLHVRKSLLDPIPCLLLLRRCRLSPCA